MRSPWDNHYLCEKEREKERSWANLRRTLAPPFFLCSILVFFFFFYPPNPFKISADQHVFHQNQNQNQNQNVEEKNCSLSAGRWVEDLNGSMYTNLSCGTIPESKNCLKNGRMDRVFLNWRWKPDGCNLPRFDPNTFLQIVRGKKMAFIGDSVARNHFESLLCLLSKEEIPLDVHKDSEDRFRTWHFPYYDFTLMVLWSKFLVIGDEKIINGSNSGIFDIQLDKIDSKWAQKLPGLDYAIISDAHWFFRKIYIYQGDVKIGCVYCNDPNVTDRGPEFAIRMSLRAALNYINDCKDCERVMTLIRTFSPAHFENGTWNNGGSCNRVGPREESEVELADYYLGLRNIQFEEYERVRKFQVNIREKRFELLDVTRPMMMRPDGHPGAYSGNKWMKGYNDCIHWCLPGPIDVWNEFLLAILWS